MFDFIDNVRVELLEDFINILDFISLGSLSLYDRITENLIFIIRAQLRKPRREDDYLLNTMENENVVTELETPETGADEDNEIKAIQEGEPAEPVETIKELQEEGDNEHVEGEQIEGEHVMGEYTEDEERQEAKLFGESESLAGEEMVGEQVEGEETEEEKKEEQKPTEEVHVDEEEGYVEEPPPDPAAPFNLSDSTEALKPKFELRPDQIAEVEQIWELYQNYTPAYTDIDGYITEKELVYMLKALLLMTYTPEQLQELITYCVKPPHHQGHINYNQFLKMVTLRQRDFPIEEELRSALQVLDPGRTGLIDREYFKELLAKQGHRLPQKQLDNLIKEVDISNDGTIGIEDVVGTMCIDLNKEDLFMLMASIFPEGQPNEGN